MAAVSDMSQSANKDDATIRRKNELLLEDIYRYCSREDRTHVGNILLIGLSGAGKSALINTVISAIAGEYLPRARVGRGNIQTNTPALHWYKHCGVKLEDLQRSSNEDFLRKLVLKLPNLFDWAGQGDDNSLALTEKLKYLIGGYIKPGTTISALEDFQTKHGVGKFGSIFKKANPEWKITTIVFVQSGKEKVPKNLIQCLQSVLRATNEKTGQLLYDVQIFTVISKFDLVSKTGHDDDDIEIIDGRNQPEAEMHSDPDGMLMAESKSDNGVSMDDFNRIEDRVAKELMIEGATQHSSIRWVSYVDKTGYEDQPYINNIALKFLKLVVMPGRDQTDVVDPLVPWDTEIKLKISKMWEGLREILGMNFTLSSLFLALVVLVVLVLLFHLLNASLPPSSPPPAPNSLPKTSMP